MVTLEHCKSVRISLGIVEDTFGIAECTDSCVKYYETLFSHNYNSEQSDSFVEMKQF